MSAMISLRDVSKVYESARGPVVGMEGVDLDIEQGEFITIVGPSGCGKSTMLNIIAGLIRSSSGTVEVNGKPVKGPGPERGMIFQQYALFPWLTARQNVEFGLRIQGMRARERRARAEHFLELVGIANFGDALPRELSGGMKQRCAIARAYAVDPEILLMDEPFGALDALTRVRMQDELLETWQKDRRTAAFITHDVEEAVYLANRVVIMSAHPGRIDRIIDVPLPYPRTAEMRLSSRFAEIRSSIWKRVHRADEESARQEAADPPGAPVPTADGATGSTTTQ